MENTVSNPFADWTTVQDAAEQIGRDPNIVRYWAKQGYIRSYVVGKSTRLVNIKEVETYAKRHQPHKSED